MAAPKEATEAQIAHQALLDELDIHSIHKSFRNASWRPNQRRNKNIKTILGDASRREASALATPQQEEASAAATPTTDKHGGGRRRRRPLDERHLDARKRHRQRQRQSQPGTGLAHGGPGPSVTYTNIESAPSLAHTRRYCDITGLPAPYVDPKTRLRYHDKEVFGLIRTLPQGAAEQYLEARGAHTVLK
ncbi:hypothetical protein CH063_09091 [Colletotrichum higginsianum]|uniref:Vps72/YL1 C-terminal domain-containing protein n=1 Tax=Colletotrichum higginsianum (strain IMI 349063) TaxID=759273 RepID=H1VCA0_COLHI|nr:hypothetical protein CH063_09091 [Colletotrichum higginsianum]